MEARIQLALMKMKSGDAIRPTNKMRRWLQKLGWTQSAIHSACRGNGSIVQIDERFAEIKFCHGGRKRVTRQLAREMRLEYIMWELPDKPDREDEGAGYWDCWWYPD